MGSSTPWQEEQPRDPVYVVTTMTVVYSLIFLTGVIGNVSTCIVIVRNKHMHTTTNYYLFSLAVSDLLLLVSGLPPEMYMLWSKSYVFGEAFCVLTGFMAETCANATVLTITAFTIERYIAICHPFLSHSVSKLSRAVKFVILIWIFALILAIPQAIQFGVVNNVNTDRNGTAISSYAECTMKGKKAWVEHAFRISTCVFFIFPMTVITCLYVLIGLKLRKSKAIKRPALEPLRGQNHVIRLLVAVVVAFFICWAPFHAQRLLAVYAYNSASSNYSTVLLTTYKVLTYISGILYYLSTTVNPLLYNIMSNKFRDAFKNTQQQLCCRKDKVSVPTRTYSVLSRMHHISMDGHVPEPNRLQLARPATISNSSLQDIEEEEYNGSELAQYMGQLNTS
ncbi:pyrokinin-1 receptor-like [Cimex lectularius]|uniref:G-protein coupled receptors family 1 profile domain-containing protein n=1 Tax=Cimex lectularius TaxID=79782 RepID=A0A8I6SJD5_CIMLE|nr:pyrokinin-1 receptor-like [Cimex lectularius]XP_024084341.1 pyrokinin-1 receptor-like [Cimex lectularius]